MVLEFMDNTKNDHYYLEKIKKDIAFIVIHMKNSYHYFLWGCKENV